MQARRSSFVAPFDETTIQLLERLKNTLHIAQTNASQTRGRKENKKRWIVVRERRKIEKAKQNKVGQGVKKTTINFSLLLFSLFSSFSFLLLFSTSLSYLIDRETGWRIE